MLCGGGPGELRELTFGAGDSHRKGRTVAIVRTEAGRLVYKPRSLVIDIALHNFIGLLPEGHGNGLVNCVPAALDFDDHGWGEFIAHRYASGPAELKDFYHEIGQWLAIMRLLGGNDLHAENLIANGRHPVIVDCETLFVPKIPPSPSGYGHALDRAVRAGLWNGAQYWPAPRARLGPRLARGRQFGSRDAAWRAADDAYARHPRGRLG